MNVERFMAYIIYYTYEYQRSPAEQPNGLLPCSSWKPGTQTSQVGPVTYSLQVHSPERGSHTAPSTDPNRLQAHWLQLEERNGKVKISHTKTVNSMKWALPWELEEARLTAVTPASPDPSTGAVTLTTVSVAHTAGRASLAAVT